MLTVPKQYQEAANMDFFQYVICTGYQMYLSSVEVLCTFFPQIWVLLQFLRDNSKLASKTEECWGSGKPILFF